MITADRLTTKDQSCVTPSYRERARVDLASGYTVGQTVLLSRGVPTPIALDLACGLARHITLPVSLRVEPPFGALPHLFAEAVVRNGVPPDRIELAFMAEDLQHLAVETLLALSDLRDQGADLALADFGGPGTLDLLQHLPLSTVILKPSFIEGLPGNATAATLLHNLFRIARRHGMRIVAANIESEAQRALLSGLGCERGEGGLFGTAVLGGPGA